MSQTHSSGREALSRDERIRQLIDDYIDRRVAGETVSDERLMAEHAELMPELEEALRDVQLIQQARQAADEMRSAGLQIRCPHCHEPMEVVDDHTFSDLLCSSCGSPFGLTDDSDPTFPEGQQEMVNHFQLLERVGIGAFGVVWKARDTQLDRIVALKIPRKGQLSAEEAEQFVREARAAAQLKHPNIVSVLEVGRFQDRIYLACDYIEGLDLADWLVDGQPTPREAAELCATLADALSHAHLMEVIHRDVKPSNIMLDAEGEPHLMDFGLAKRESGEVTMTVDGKLLGTPAYMSPEQARGDAHRADARSDVYSLGVILFELLTGERPFRGNTRMLLEQILLTDAPNPRQLNDRVPRDLANICLKCLEKDPSQRYKTAGDLRDDLRRFLNGKPVVARPLPTSFGVWRWARRNPAQAALLGLAPLIILAMPFVAILISTFTVEHPRLLAFFHNAYNPPPYGDPPDTIAYVLPTIRFFNLIVLSFSVILAAMAAGLIMWHCAHRRPRIRFAMVLGNGILIGSAILLIGYRLIHTVALQRHVDLVHASGGSVLWARESILSALFLPHKTSEEFYSEEFYCWQEFPFLGRILGECTIGGRPEYFWLGPAASTDDLAEVFSSGVYVARIDLEEMSKRTLEVLSAQTQGIFSLRLSGDAISDDVMQLVAQLPRLSYLTLNRTRVTADGIAQLAKMKSLHKINVINPHMAESGIRALGEDPRFFVKRGTGYSYSIWITDVPTRDDNASAQQLNLDPFYNHAFKGRWISRFVDDDDLSELPTGIQTFEGVSYDVRGLVQFCGEPSNLWWTVMKMSYPIEATFMERIHFLHGTIDGQQEPLGTVVGKYTLRYADGAIEERPIVFGKDVLDWHATPDETDEGGPTVAWSGSNAESRRQGRTIQLYQTTWENPRPGVEVVGLDVDAADTDAALFLVAVTVE